MYDIKDSMLFPGNQYVIKDIQQGKWLIETDYFTVAWNFQALLWQFEEIVNQTRS